MRIDRYLFESAVAESRNKAQAMLASGVVFIGGRRITKPSYNYLPESGEVVEIKGETLKFVGRGGLKLEGALDSLGIDVTGLVCIDIGASTGGFTDCLLSKGALFVYALDSGHGQLHPKLAADERVRSLEGCNARELCKETIGKELDFAVMDVSFISQTLLHRGVASVLKKGGGFVSLIKPQFEVGKSNVGKGGIVRDEKLHRLAVDRVNESAAACGFIAAGCIKSPVKGSDGNTEFLAYYKFIGKDQDYEDNCNYSE